MKHNNSLKDLQDALLCSKGPSKIFYRAFYSNPLIMSVSEMETGRIIIVNHAFCLFFDIPQEEAMGKTSLELNLWANPANRSAMIDNSRLMERPVDWMVEMKTHSGSRVRGLLHFEGMEWNGRRLILSIVKDIVPISASEKEFTESSRFFESMVLRFPLPMLIHAGTLIMVINLPAIRMLHGDSSSQFIGRRILDFLHPDYHEIAEERINTIYNKRKEAAFIEEKFVCLDSAVIEVEVAANAIDFNGKPASQVVFKDITERKLLEAETLKAQKLEAVGLLAGGIAHDFNNILTVISGNISLAALEVGANDRLLTLMDQAEKALQRAQGLTRQLLTFSRGGDPIKENSSVQDLIKDSTDFVLRGSRSTCSYSFEEGLWPVDIDRGQISQVFLNIVINAAQSMPNGGIVEIHAGNVVLEQTQVPVLAPGPYVKITVRDSGIGIAPDYLNKIFDPYFSTKKSGSGLGLAVVYSIIKKHNGAVSVASEAGKGSEFTIYLPARADTTPQPAPGSEKKLIMGRGRILIMDDDPDVLESMLAMTEALGYSTHGVTHGEEAIYIFKKMKLEGSPFDAVIMDLTIPGAMGGQQAVQKVLEFDPGARVIVASGYSNDTVLADFKHYGFSGVLTKPVFLNELSRVLDALIKKNHHSPDSH